MNCSEPKEMEGKRAGGGEETGGGCSPEGGARRLAQPGAPASPPPRPPFRKRGFRKPGQRVDRLPGCLRRTGGLGPAGVGKEARGGRALCWGTAGAPGPSVGERWGRPPPENSRPRWVSAEKGEGGRRRRRRRRTCPLLGNAGAPQPDTAARAGFLQRCLTCRPLFLAQVRLAVAVAQGWGTLRKPRGPPPVPYHYCCYYMLPRTPASFEVCALGSEQDKKNRRRKRLHSALCLLGSKCHHRAANC